MEVELVSAVSVQLVNEPAPLLVKATLPTGLDLVGLSVSLTVAVQVVPWLIATEADEQLTEVEVVRVRTLMSKLPLLV